MSDQICLFQVMTAEHKNQPLRVIDLTIPANWHALANTSIDRMCRMAREANPTREEGGEGGRG